MARRFSVVGLGKLGASMAASIASRGHDVIGVDVIHHSPHPLRIVEQARRYMSAASELRLMVYARISYKLFWIMRE